MNNDTRTVAGPNSSSITGGSTAGAMAGIADVISEGKETVVLDGYVTHVISTCMECGTELPFTAIVNAPEDLQGVRIVCADD